MLLSVLDQSPISAGGTAADAVAETLERAQACDRWGYHRYWLAEHGRRRTIAGDPDRCGTASSPSPREHSAEEIMVVSITHDFKARLRSYQLLSEVFGLRGGGAGVARVEVIRRGDTMRREITHS